MPRNRQRLTPDGGPRLDLAKLIPKGASRPGAHIRAAAAGNLQNHSPFNAASPVSIWRDERTISCSRAVLLRFCSAPS